MSRTRGRDQIPTSEGDLWITFLGHASLIFEWKGITIHVDPVSAEADYATLPKADLILVTHEHFDHLDPEAVSLILKPGTEIILNSESRLKLPHARVLRNGEHVTVLGLAIEAVPAYNITGMRSAGVPYHPRGVGNGYILRFGNVRLYVAGDTENTPEMKALKEIDIAFLPMMRPYAMSPEMIADAVRAFRPRLVYPYHTKEADAKKVAALVSDIPDVEIRFRY